MAARARLGAWIAVAWGGETSAPSGGSYHLALEVSVPDGMTVDALDALQVEAETALLARYDHRELTEQAFLPAQFLSAVATEFTGWVAAHGSSLCAVHLRDHEQWMLSLTCSPD